MVTDFEIGVESDREEHKEIVNEKLLHDGMCAICAFLNGSGGKLIFGVDKNQNAVGLSSDLDLDQRKIFDELTNHIRPNPHPHVKVVKKDKLIYCFAEPGRHTVYLYRNVCYLRTGSSTHAISYDEMKALENQKSSGLQQIADDIFATKPGPEAWQCDTCGLREVSALASQMFIGSPPQDVNSKPCSSPIYCPGTMRKKAD